MTDTQKKGRVNVRGHRRGRSRVRAHTRSHTWKSSKRQWAATGFSALTAGALVLQAGLSLITLVAVLILALCNLAMWLLTGDQGQKRRTARTRKTGAGGRSTRRRTSRSRRR